MTPQITLYHHPRCSKSRQVLALLQEKGAAITIIEYLKTPPSPDEIAQLLKQLGVSVRDIIRNKEEDYKKLHMDDMTLSDTNLIHLLHKHPHLIERPIAIHQNQARIGRPPEKVLELL